MPGTHWHQQSHTQKYKPVHSNVLHSLAAVALVQQGFHWEGSVIWVAQVTQRVCYCQTHSLHQNMDVVGAVMT